MRFLKFLLVPLFALLLSPVAFAGNCGESDQFLTCNTGNVALLKDTTTISPTFKWSMRTGRANYNAVSVGTLTNYMIGTLGVDTVNTFVTVDSAKTGYATPPTDTLRCACSSTFTSCRQVGGLSGTSNGAALTIGTLPAACRPSGTVVVGIAQVTDDGVTRYGIGSVAATGIITVSKTDTAGVQSATFTTSGTKGVGAGTVYSFPRY